MFKYSRASFRIILRELASITFFITLITSLLTIAYLVYATVVGNGERVINIALCALTAINLITYLLMNRAERKRVKNVRKCIAHICNITKLCLTAVSLGIIVYAAAVTPDEVSAVSLVLLPLLIILWVLKAILEMAILYFDSRFRLVLDAWQMDMEPVTKVKGFVGAMVGEDVEEPDPVNPHNERILKKNAAQYEAEHGKKKSGTVKKLVGHVVGRVLKK